MASENNLFNRVERLIKAQRLCPEMTVEELRALYHRLNWNLIDYVEFVDENQEWYTKKIKREWGEGPNESFEDFEKCAAYYFWAVEQWPKSEWRVDAENYRINPEHLGYAQFLGRKTLERFYDIRNERTTKSPYYFGNLELFFLVLSHNNWDSSIMEKPAAWWSTLEEMNLPIRHYRFAKKAMAGLVVSNRDAVLAELDRDEFDFSFLELVGRVFAPHNLIRKLNNVGMGQEAISKVVHALTPESIEMVESYLPKRTGGWIAEGLNLGLPPFEILHQMFTKKQAHKVCMCHLESHENINRIVVSSLFADASMELKNIIRKLPNLTPLLVKWLQRKSGNKALFKQRIVYGPAGATKEFRYVDILDEISDEDLVNGEKTSVELAFQNASDRKQKIMEAEMGKNVHFDVLPVRFPDKRINQIVTSDALKQEGEKMSHCVAGYTKYCLKGSVTIWHVDNGEHATIEVSNKGEGWKVYQIQGKDNSTPTDSLIKLVQSWAKKNNIERV